MSPDIAATIEAAGVRVIRVAVDDALSWLDRVASPGALPIPGEASRLYLTTSGSSGEPKAIVLDADRLWSSGRAFIGRHRFVDQDARFYNILPVSYLGGLFNLCLIPLAAGGSFVVAEAFSGKAMLGFWQSLEQHEVNVLWAVPSMVRALLTIADRTKRERLVGPKLRGCFLGTAGIDLPTKERFETFIGAPVLENYALSETTFLTSEAADDGLPRAPGSVGPALPYSSLRFEPVAGAEDAAPGEQAPTEIRAKTPFLFLGYMGDDGQVNLPVDQDGYFPTGDLGHLIDGTVLSIDGRLREVVKKGGFFISLREIETIAETHEAVAEAAAVPVAHEFYGETYRLFLRLKGNGSPEETTAGFGAWLRDRVVRYKWPDGISVIEDFPRTASGKIRKSVLAEGPRP